MSNKPWWASWRAGAEFTQWHVSEHVSSKRMRCGCRIPERLAAPVNRTQNAPAVKDRCSTCATIAGIQPELKAVA